MANKNPAMDDTIIEKRPVGRPRLSEAEKQRRAELRKTGELPKRVQPNRTPAKKPNFGQEHIEPGDNSRYLGHALAIAHMPVVDLNSIEEVSERIEWYFNHCFGNDMKPTVSGLCNALKISRNTLMTWKNGTYREGTHQAVILEAYGIMESLWEDYMQNGKINPVSGIFLGKNNYGYTDKQEMVLTPNRTEVTAEDVATIEAKYDELPEGD